VPFSSADCARVRESVSVQLDGELPELELDRLETHLRFCPECSTWADEVHDLTLRLREASLEMPASRFALPRRRRSWRVSSAVALASAAAVVATMFVSPSGQRASVGQHSAPELLLSASGVRISTPRLVRLEDGRSAAISTASTSQVRFRPV
jgi:predicted anti-sigma-YlaC factor YlaD